VKQVKENRRVQYTRAVLKSALAQLMQEKHISGITVKAICELADVNRSTFYLHYSDPYDLLHQVEQEVYGMFKTQLAEMEDDGAHRPVNMQIMIKILEYARESADLCKALLSENSDFDFKKDIMGLTQLFSFEPDKAYAASTKEYLTLYCMNGSISIIEKWLKDGALEPVEQVAEIVMQCLFYGMLSFAPQAPAKKRRG
jgi:AcrR family transcriptional regulator